MPLEHFCQIRFIEVSLLEKLFNAHLVLGASHAGGDGDDVFGAENFRRDAFVFDPFGLVHGFLRQSVGGKELDGESTDQKMFALDLPALGLQICINGGNSGGQACVLGNEKISAS